MLFYFFFPLAEVFKFKTRGEKKKIKLGKLNTVNSPRELKLVDHEVLCETEVLTASNKLRWAEEKENGTGLIYTMWKLRPHAKPRPSIPTPTAPTQTSC